MIDDQVLHQWMSDDVRGPLADRLTTEIRRQEWDRLATECREEVEKDYPDLREEIQMAVQIRSRMKPDEIPKEEYDVFSDQVRNNQRRQVVGKKRRGADQ